MALSHSNHDSYFLEARRSLLSKELDKLSIDPDALNEAWWRVVEDPSRGYDGRFGKSAIRCFRAFVNSSQQESEEQLRIMAGRTARQIDFLIKRHESHQTEWIRHHDAEGEQQRQVFPLILILDNLRSAYNVGSIFRTADAAGCAELWTTGITPHPKGGGAEKVQKASLGAELVVPNRHFSTVHEAIKALREEKPCFQLIGLETTEKSVCYTDLEYDTGGAALVLGNEVTGVAASVLADMDQIVEIPTFGAKNSLNVASCAPIVLYEIIRQWKS